MLPSIHHGHAEAALDGGIFGGGTFVVQLLALAQPHEDLRATVLVEIQPQRHEC